MSCEPEIAAALQARGLRRTTQRARILATLRHAAGGLTAAEVHVRLLEPASHESGDDETTPISLSTVYRTVDGLRDAGIVSMHESPGGATFEWAGESTTHHHLRCVRCGSTQELEVPRLVQMEAQIQKLSGFEASIRHLALTGLCRECAAASEGAGLVQR